MPSSFFVGVAFSGTQAPRRGITGYAAVGMQARRLRPIHFIGVAHSSLVTRLSSTQKIVTLKTKNCHPGDKKLSPWRQKIVTLETKNCHPGDKKLSPWRQKIVTLATKNCHPGDKKLSPWRQKIVTLETKNCHPGDKKLPPRETKNCLQGDKKLPPGRQTILKGKK